MIKLITLLFFNFNLGANIFHLVSVKKQTATSGLFALSYFSYKYGPKTVAKKLPFILSLSGMVAGMQNNNQECSLISTTGFVLSIFSYLVYTHRKFLASLKALPVFSILLGVSVGIKKEDKKFILGSLGILPIYFVYSNRHILSTKKILFQLFCCCLCICGGYKLLTDYRLRQIMNSSKIIKFVMRNVREIFINCFLFIVDIEFSTLYSSSVIHDAIKNFVKKNNFFSKMPRSLFLSIMTYAPILIFVEKINNFYFGWNSIKKPCWYDDAVSLKIEQTKCFYNPYEGKDHTATLCGRLEAKPVFDLNQIDPNSIKNIIGMIIMALSPA